MMTNGNMTRTETKNKREDMKELLREREKMVNLRNDRVVTMMMEIVAQELGEDIDIFDDKSRKRNVVVAKQMVSCAIRELDKSVPLSYIAKRLKSHHATIIYSIKSFGNVTLNDPLFKQKFDLVMARARKPFSTLDSQEALLSHYYYINLNNCISIRFENGKSVILSGYTMDEAKMMCAMGSDGISLSEPREHTNTGFYILEGKVGGEDTPSNLNDSTNPLYHQ